MEKERNVIKFGQVWKAVKDYQISESWSFQKDCVILFNSRVVVVNTPVRGATHFHILLLNSKGLDERLSPNLEKMEKEKEGFGITIEIKKFRECFVKDDNQSISFDNADAAMLWEEILVHTLTKEADDARARTV
jgi:hypothetical protein